MIQWPLQVCDAWVPAHAPLWCLTQLGVILVILALIILQAHSQAYATLTDLTFPLRLISLKLTYNTHHATHVRSLDRPGTESPIHNELSRASPHIYLQNQNLQRL